MSMNLKQILSLVGKLDDSIGDETPRERFRRFLKETILEVGQIRDYIEECLRYSGEQYNRALQDLVNYVGHFLKFDVTFGRYHGITGEIGFDGYWKSHTDFHVVVEVKTSEVYAIKTNALIGYVDKLISEKKIPNWDKALGLYVVGRTDPEIKTLENAIIAEKRTDQLRIISVDSLLLLVDMISVYDISHEDILSVIKPSGPTIDLIVQLMNRLVVGKADTETDKEDIEQHTTLTDDINSGEETYWLTPVKSDEDETAEQCIQRLVGQENIYAISERTPGRKEIKSGDWICFYANTKGIIAHAKVISNPEQKKHKEIRNSDKYSFVFNLKETGLYIDDPVIIDAGIRTSLDAFQGKDPIKRWAWFVQCTHKISKHDFSILTRK